MKKVKLTLMDYSSCAYLAVYAASAVATPVCLVILSKELNLNLSEGGTIESVRALLLTLILLISGIAAARWGKPAVLTAGGILLTGGLIFYGLAPSFSLILLAMVFVGLGGGLLEALINPLIQDLHPRNSGAYLNIVNAFFSIGVLGTVLTVGELLTAQISWRYIFLGLGVLCLLVSLFFLGSTIKTSREGMLPAKPVGNPLDHATQLLKNRRFWVFGLAMICGGGTESAYTFWSASYIQLTYDTGPRAGALGTAIFAAGMITGRIAGGLVKQKHIYHQIMISALGGLLISFGFFYIRSLTGLFVLLFPAGLAVACFWPSLQSYGVDRIRGDSTMIFILLSVMGIPGFAVTSWLMGLIGDRMNLRISFALIPLYFGVLAAVMLFERFSGGAKDPEDLKEEPVITDPL